MGGLENRLMRERVRGAKLQNAAAARELASPLSSMQRFENVLDSRHGRRMDERSLDIAQNGQMRDLLGIASYHSDPSNVVQQLLNRAGVTAQLQPKAVDPRVQVEQMRALQMAALMQQNGGQEEVDPELAAQMNQFLEQKLQQP